MIIEAIILENEVDTELTVGCRKVGTTGVIHVEMVVTSKVHADFTT
jgi:hypothetical protein